MFFVDKVQARAPHILCLRRLRRGGRGRRRPDAAYEVEIFKMRQSGASSGGETENSHRFREIPRRTDVF
jgi:hypothetical protein